MIGAKTVMGQECTISAFQHVSVGRECIIADRVMLIDFDHGVVEVERPIRVQGIYKRDVHVGHNCWIGYGACVLRGVTVGDNSVIGTSSVVTKDLPPNSVAAGLPARVLRMRDEPERSAGVELGAADRPGRGAALGEQLRRHRVLDGLRRPRGIAPAAERAPGGAGELVLAAVAAARGDRGRVAAGLAARDPRERRRGAAAGRRRFARGRAEMPSARSVAGPAMPSTVRPWERWKRRTARRVTGPKAPSAVTPSARWSATTVPPPAPDLSVAPPVPAAAVVPPAPSAATAAPATRVMAASRAPAPPRPTRFRRACRAASARRRREARSDASQGLAFAGSKFGTATSWVLAPTGLAVGLARRPALRRAQAAIRPGSQSAPSGPPFPASGRRGFGVFTSFEPEG